MTYKALKRQLRLVKDQIARINPLAPVLASIDNVLEWIEEEEFQEYLQYKYEK